MKSETLGAPQNMPWWIDPLLLTLCNLALAFAFSALLVWFIGESPLAIAAELLRGAFGGAEAVGYTLFYATNFIFTGLAVAVAYHCGLFNIGGEGQAYIGGLGLGLVALYLDFLPFPLLLLAAMLAAALFGAGWSLVPAVLQAKRGSHVVITTIMFNFIAAALMNYLLVNVLIKPGSMSPETRVFADSTHLPMVHDLAAAVGLSLSASPLNLSFFIALLCCAATWLFLWHTPWGYEVRTVGGNPRAAVYAGISPSRCIILAMCLSGGLAGLLSLNEILGSQHRLLIEFTAGYGFVGIAVALMGRSHPAGIVLAAILFGALYQGGAELAYTFERISKDIVIVIQGLVILFTGALGFMLRPPLGAAWARIFRGGGGRAVA